MSSREIYLDNAATTWPSPEVLKAVREFQDKRPGNASSLHKAGVEAAKAVEAQREVIAKRLGATADEIIFTSGGTEANNLALRGYLEANKQKGKHLIVSQIEHSSVLETARWLETQGYRVSFAPVDHEGFVLMSELEKLITPETTLISIMHANNEVGALQDLAAISSICKKHQIGFHVDAAQSFCKHPINVSEINIDLVSLSGHKIHGPTGIGALYVKNGIALSPIMFGGKQERGYRSGTYHAEGIVAFGAAVSATSADDTIHMCALRDFAIDVLKDFPNVIVNGPRGERRLCNNINISLTKAVAKTVMFELSKKNIYVSTGSACSSGKKNPSHVLLAMGRNESDARECLRISLSRLTSKEDMEHFLTTLKGILDVA